MMTFIHTAETTAGKPSALHAGGSLSHFMMDAESWLA
jgi:hypothetical protein